MVEANVEVLIIEAASTSLLLSWTLAVFILGDASGDPVTSVLVIGRGLYCIHLYVYIYD